LSDDPTRELPKEGSFEVRVLAELGAIRSEHVEIRGELAEIRFEQAATRTDIASLDSRLTALEDKVDSRLRETRPIWEAVQLAIKHLDMKFDNVIRDLYDVRTKVGMLDQRLRELEAR